MAPKPQAPTDTSDDEFDKAIAETRKKIAPAGGASSIPAGAVSPSSRSAIGVEGTQTLDPLTGKSTGYFGFQSQEKLPQLGGFEPAGQVAPVRPRYFSGDEDGISKFSTEQIAHRAHGNVPSDNVDCNDSRREGVQPNCPHNYARSDRGR